LFIGTDVNPLVGTGDTAPAAQGNGLRCESISVAGGYTEFYCKGNRLAFVNAGGSTQATNKAEIEVFG